MRLREIAGGTRGLAWLLLVAASVSLVQCSSRSKALVRAGASVSFYGDESTGFERPIPLPDEVIRLLAEDPEVKRSLELKKLSEGNFPRNWFLASAAQLGGTLDDEIVVRGESTYVRGVNVVWFWVFRRVDGHYELILFASGLALTVMKATTNGYHDILAGAMSSNLSHTRLYKFGGTKYELHSEEVGELEY
jgi:hypothetical protein